MILYNDKNNPSTICCGDKDVCFVYAGDYLVWLKITPYIIVTNSISSGFSIDVNGWDRINLSLKADLPTKIEIKDKITRADLMFRYCQHLKSLYLHIDTSNATRMDEMFSECNKLVELDISCIRTPNVTNMYRMFYNCNLLPILDLSNFDTSKVTNMESMFNNCTKLTLIIGIENFNTDKITSTSNMFGGCYNLQSLDLSSWNTSNITNMYRMFIECNRLVNLDISSFDTSKVTNMGGMFGGCKGLTSLDVSNFNTSNVTDMSSMFGNCNALTSLDISSFDTSNVTNMGGMFNGCKNITSLDLSSFDTSNVTNMSGMFGSVSVPALDLSNFDTSNVTDMSSMFNGYKSPSLDLSSFDTSNVTNMGSMFYNCTSLNLIDVSNFDTSKVTNMGGMFGGCKSLPSLDLTNFDTSNVTNMNLMFLYSDNLTLIKGLENFDTANVTEMGYMFNGCKNITSLDLSSFNTSKVTNMNRMFYDCEKLEYLDVSNFDISKVIYKLIMFKNCNSLKHIKCNKAFKDWCYNTDIYYNLPISMRKNGDGIWEVIDDIDESTILVELILISADNVSKYETTTNVSYTIIGTAYYNYYNEVGPVILTGVEVSEDFGVNETNIDRIIDVSLTKYGATAVTTITQSYKCYKINLNDSWQISETIVNPDESLYDGVYESFSNYNVNSGIADMSINIFGCNKFSIYVRSYAESSCDYVIVYSLDSTSTEKATTKGKLSGTTTIDGYTLVTFDNIDGGLHTINIRYKKDDSVNKNDDRGYLLIPKQ